MPHFARPHLWEHVVALGATGLALIDYAPKLAAVAAVIYYIMLGISWIVNKGWRPK